MLLVGQVSNPILIRQVVFHCNFIARISFLYAEQKVPILRNLLCATVNNHTAAGTTIFLIVSTGAFEQ